MSEVAADARRTLWERTMTQAHTLYRFVGAFVDELARSGLQHACICPGSRSTPLALLLQQHATIKTWLHLDERSAAFFALGQAKASCEPVVLVATSGTATINFAPAVVEAYYAHIPLLVLTADRPPELRDVGAPQTIDQVRLYGPHVKWYAEMLLPEASEWALRHARTVACRAVATARAERPGPVHLNFPFREPLIPIGEGELVSERDARSSGTSRPFVTVTQAPQMPQATDIADLAAELRTVPRGLIVCGPQDDPRFPAQVVQLAQELDVPLLADPLSQVRCGPHYGHCIIDSYDVFLRDARLVETLRPDLILRFGATPVSKPLSLYLQQYATCRQVLVEAADAWHDPGLIASDILRADPRLFCEKLRHTLSTSAPQSAQSNGRTWRQHWRWLDEQARLTIQRCLNTSTDLSEPRVFVELADVLPPGATLFAGNSMPVRDLDTFFPGGKRPIRFLANRGVNGIDGVVSTALGVSASGSEPLVLVIGDLSFYHDLNGLLAVQQHQLQATIVLLHNDGGGIFSFLPQAEYPEHFEVLFGTPHGLDFRHAAQLYDLGYQQPDDVHTFRAAVQDALGSPGVTLIDVRIERQANVDLHRRIWQAVSHQIHAREHTPCPTKLTLGET